jgi:type VI secretion system protein ImpL
MSKSLIKVIQHKWVIQWVGIIAFSILIWWVGPMLTVAGKAPLDLAANRFLTILLIVIIWLTYHLVSLSKSNQTDLQLMAELSVSQEDLAPSFVLDAKNKEAAELKRKFQSALRGLKEIQSDESFNQQYIYKLPWYIIIGAPGSGKTTLLSNSGINFPIKDDAGVTKIRGIGGTRNCDWLFSDEAIFIDTAGRYTTQDSDKDIDAAGWKRFLKLLKKYRPQRPVNGVLFTLSLSDMLTWSEEELGRHARILRQRVMELHEILSITIPIYLILTKCDLIAGFTEFFEDLDPEERKQVWGFTLAADQKEFIKTTPTHLEELQKRLQKKRIDRIQQERDLVQRGLIIDFPQQMELFKPLLMRFLEQTFNTGHVKPQPLLRGIYFTSGTQKGTPIDRVTSHLADAFGLNIRRLSVFSGHVKTFFISRLFTEVILPESELAGVDLGVMRRRTLLRWAVNGAVLGLMTILIILWFTSYTRNTLVLNRINGLMDHYGTLQKKASRFRIDSDNLLDRLDTIVTVKKAFPKQRWWEGFGLYQGKKLQWEIQRIYHKLLLYDLLGLIKLHIEYDLKQYIMAANNYKKIDSSKLYDLLKVYLMIGRSEKMDSAMMYDWAKLENKKIFPKDSFRRAQMQTHLDALFKLSLDAISLDQKLIIQARDVLNSNPLYFNLYTNLKRQMLKDHAHDFYLKDVIDPNGLSILTTVNGQSVHNLKIPGWYTLEGYHDVFETKGVLLIEEALKESWVLGTPAQNQKVSLGYIYRKLQDLYFADYERYWRSLLNNLKIKRAENLDQTIHITDTLAGPDTPLIPILMALNKHTGFVFPPHRNWSKLKNAQAAVPGQVLPKSARDVANKFKDISDLVTPTGNQAPPIDRVLLQLARLRDKLLLDGYDDAKDVIFQSRQIFSHLPEPLVSWLMSLLEST